MLTWVGAVQGGGRAAPSQPEETWPPCELALEPTWPPGNRPFEAGKEGVGTSQPAWLGRSQVRSPPHNLILQTEGLRLQKIQRIFPVHSQEGQASNAHGNLLGSRRLPGMGVLRRGAASQASSSPAATSVTDDLGGSRVSI